MSSGERGNEEKEKSTFACTKIMLASKKNSSPFVLRTQSNNFSYSMYLSHVSSTLYRFTHLVFTPPLCSFPPPVCDIRVDLTRILISLYRKTCTSRVTSSATTFEKGTWVFRIFLGVFLNKNFLFESFIKYS